MRQCGQVGAKKGSRESRAPRHEGTGVKEMTKRPILQPQELWPSG